MKVDALALFLAFWDEPLPRAGLWFALKAKPGVIMGSEGYLQSPTSLNAEIAHLIRIGWLVDRDGMLGWSENAKQDFPKDETFAFLAQQLKKIF